MLDLKTHCLQQARCTVDPVYDTCLVYIAKQHPQQHINRPQRARSNSDKEILQHLDSILGLKVYLKTSASGHLTTNSKTKAK